MKKLLIATKNPGKFAEILEVLKSQDEPLADYEFLSLADLKIKDEVEEHGVTHEENAILKARYFFNKTGLPTLGEDSGVHVDAFPGELGVQTRRWAGLGAATDAKWIKCFLGKMSAISADDRGAKFICCAALILDDETYRFPRIFIGETRGIITKIMEAPLKPGIPISSCFRPSGFSKVYAALTVAEKNGISHRGKAISKVREYLCRPDGDGRTKRNSALRNFKRNLRSPLLQAIVFHDSERQWLAAGLT
ncbi:non-canonical purine NTP pyrophosphatase [Candidatus Peregrinibacteria bacterium]|nr:non-canonical purine NTP pyrophosphatase [Candidatus Peregrinibacteria bacterium]